jgi:urease accessory protein
MIAEPPLSRDCGPDAVTDIRLAATTTDPRGLVPPTPTSRNNWLLWQLADSAFPTGGFAHSGGLEAAWQHGEVRNRDELREWLKAGLHQLATTALIFVSATHAGPERLDELDRLCEVFTSNHVANRASRLQGRALLAAVERIFPERGLRADSTDSRPTAPFGHLAPVFGAVTRSLGVVRDDSLRLFVFTHLRGVLAAAVRLNIVGPMDAQAIQFHLSSEAEAVAGNGAELGLDDLAQTAPLLDLWQGAQDRLYSRLFQS